MPASRAGVFHELITLGPEVSCGLKRPYGDPGPLRRLYVLAFVQSDIPVAACLAPGPQFLSMSDMCQDSKHPFFESRPGSK